MKNCSKCKIEKPMDAYHKRRSSMDGFQSQCKDCVSEYKKANAVELAAKSRNYRQSNPEKIASKDREYRKENAEKIAIRMQEYRKANKEKLADQRREWYKANKCKVAEKSREHRLANPGKFADRKREYAKANPERISAQHRIWRESNPDKCSAHDRNRRARVRNAEGSHTAADVRSIFEKQRGLCANCQGKLFKSGAKKYHVDHIMPLALGGSNWPSNLQCLCPACNLSKHAKDPLDWANLNGKLL